MSQVKKVYFFCTFLGYDLYFSSRFFVLFWGDEPVATLHYVLVYHIRSVAKVNLKEILFLVQQVTKIRASRLSVKKGGFVFHLCTEMSQRIIRMKKNLEK